MSFSIRFGAEKFLKGFLLALTFVVSGAQAQTWLSSPGTGDWNTSTNWGTSAVPNSQSANATFGTSNTTSVTLSAGVSLGLLEFNAGAPQYTINTNGQPLAFFGAGIVNNSSAAQSINNASLAQMNFYNSSSAGNIWLYSGFSSTVAFNNTSTAGSAWIDSNNNDNLFFNDNSSAGTATIMNLGTSNLTFNQDASAGNATINNQSNLYFGFNTGAGTVATAGNANITNTGKIYFDSSSSAGSATITTNSSGAVYFYGGTGGPAQFVFNGTGFMDISSGGVGVTLGSLAGSGSVSLGSFNLAIGSNNLNTTFSGIIANGGQGGGTGGSLTKLGTGILALTGADTYTGGTTLVGGVLNLGNSGALGTGNLTMQTGTILQAGAANLSIGNGIGLNGISSILDADGRAFTITGTVSGAGALNVLNSTGSGVLYLTGANTYSGGTGVNNNGILNIQNAGNIGNNGLVLDGGTLQAGTGGLSLSQNVTVGSVGGFFDTNGVGSNLSGIIGGSGGLAVTDTAGSGSLTLTGANTYTGGTSILAGALFVDNSGTLGSGPVSNASVLAYAGNASAGSVTILNSGLAGFLNSSTAGNALLVNDGGVSFFNGSSAGSATILNNGIVLFQGDSVSVTTTAGNAQITNNYNLGFADYSSAGNATITTNSGATVVIGFTGQGGTARFIVNNGGLFDTSYSTSGVVTVGSIEGAGYFGLGATALVEGVNNLSTVVSGTLADGGLNGGTGGFLVKTGTGSLTLSGNNTYTGGTAVIGGTLVAANANALGTGNVIVNGGTLAMGGPMTVVIGGNYTQAVGGTLQLGLGPAVTQWDKLHIAGTATLAGTLSLVPYNGFQFHDSGSLIILDATSVSGTFGTVTDSVNDGSVSLVYNPTDVVLGVKATAPSFQDLGTTGNQKNIGGVLDDLASSSPGSSLITYLDDQSNSALPGIYNQLSPANLTPLYQMGFATAQAEAGLVGSHVSQLFGEIGLNSNETSWNGQGPMFAADMPAAQEASMSKDLQPQRWGVFVNGLGNFGTVTGDGNGPGYQYSTGGTAAGLDYRFSKDFVGGLLLGYSSSGTSQSSGVVNSTGGQAGLYAGWKQESLHIEALASGGVNSYTSQRQAVGGTASGSTQGQQFSGQLGVGYDLKAGDVKLQPFASGQYTNVAINAFTETGSLAPLSFGAQNEGYLSSDLGASAQQKFEMGGWSLSPMVSAAWEHIYQGNLDSLSANFGSGSNFAVNGPATGTDAAVLGAGVNAAFAKGMNLYVQYQGKLGLTNYTEQNLSGGVNFGF